MIIWTAGVKVFAFLVVKEKHCLKKYKYSFAAVRLLLKVNLSPTRPSLFKT